LALRISSSPHLLISSSPPLLISSSPHLLISSSSKLDQYQAQVQGTFCADEVFCGKDPERGALSAHYVDCPEVP
jgi:hypothetical protein